MARKTPLQISLSFEGKGWVGKGGRVAVEGPTLRAAKQRARMAVEELYGADAEYTSSVQLPVALRDRVEAIHKAQEQLEKLRAQLRTDITDLVEQLRIKLGLGNTDSAELLNMDPSTLTRLMGSTARFKGH